MGVNVVTYDGRTLIDLREATATPEAILSGYTAWGKSGELITGTGTTLAEKTATITLTASGWEGLTQVVSIPGMTPDCTVIVEASEASENEYLDCGVQCTQQSDNALTFACEIAPVSDLTVNIVYFA